MNDEERWAALTLINAGVPIFRARAAGDGKGHNGCGFWLPEGWNHTKPDVGVLDRWKEGEALCAIMGHGIDCIDIDPRNGGDVTELDGLLPVVIGTAETPSGGLHLLINSLGVHSLDGVAPGVDLKAGVEGSGHGFIFIAPTRKRSKSTGLVAGYRWLHLPEPGIATPSDDGESLRAVIALKRGGSAALGRVYDGPTYAELDPGRQAWADRHVAGSVAQGAGTLNEAASWADGVRDGRGRGWERLVTDFAWLLAKLVAAPWNDLSYENAEEMYDLLVPEALAKAVGRKFNAGRVERARADGIGEPPWAGFDEEVRVGIGMGQHVENVVPDYSDDAHLAPWLAKMLDGRWCWAKGLNWMWWNGRVWRPRTEESVREAARRIFLRAWMRVMSDRESPDYEKKRVASLTTSGKIGAIVTLMRGVVEVDGGMFDRHPDLLNCWNGIVDLRDGSLRPHEPALLLTKITPWEYHEGAKSSDWAKSLDALDQDVQDWMQVRWGQGVTGYITSDDVLPVMQGSGANGKTTQIAALSRALGDHMVEVPAKLIQAGANDHPTELMTLRGARVAYVDETPEMGHVNVARLKAVLGRPSITARAIRQDNVSWQATHSLFLATNYVPQVAETDHGTWRRLALVRYDKVFPKDDRFRSKLESGVDGVGEAVLAWVVEGARRWYDAGRMIPDPPAKVVTWTRQWRGDSDLVMAFLEEVVEFDRDSCVVAEDLYDEFNDWIKVRGNRPWSNKLIVSRFEGHQEIRQNNVVRKRWMSAELPDGLVRRDLTAFARGSTVWFGIKVPRWQGTLGEI
jgi:putative DNA primase/helicase